MHVSVNAKSNSTMNAPIKDPDHGKIEKTNYKLNFKKKKKLKIWHSILEYL